MLAPRTRIASRKRLQFSTQEVCAPRSRNHQNGVLFPIIILLGYGINAAARWFYSPYTPVESSVRFSFFWLKRRQLDCIARTARKIGGTCEMDCDHRCDLSESSLAATLRTFTYHKHACPTSQASISCVINPANRGCLFTSGHLGLIVGTFETSLVRRRSLFFLAASGLRSEETSRRLAVEEVVIILPFVVHAPSRCCPSRRTKRR